MIEKQTKWMFINKFLTTLEGGTTTKTGKKEYKYSQNEINKNFIKSTYFERYQVYQLYSKTGIIT